MPQPAVAGRAPADGDAMSANPLLDLFVGAGLAVGAVATAGLTLAAVVVTIGSEREAPTRSLHHPSMRDARPAEERLAA